MSDAAPSCQPPRPSWQDAKDWARTSNLPKGHKATLRCLADHYSGNSGLCCPAVPTIAKANGYKERRVRQHLRDLERMGMLTPGFGRGPRGTTRYELHIGRVPLPIAPRVVARARAGAAPSVPQAAPVPPVTAPPAVVWLACGTAANDNPADQAQGAAIYDQIDAAEGGQISTAGAAIYDQIAAATPVMVAPKPEEDLTGREPGESACARASDAPDLAALDATISASACEPAQPTPSSEPARSAPEVRPAVQCAGGTKAADRWSGPNRRSAPAARLPDGWSPTAEDCAFARARGLDPDALALKFVLHYRGNGEVKASWSDVFRKWCLMELERGFRGREPKQDLLLERVAQRNAQPVARAVASRVPYDPGPPPAWVDRGRLHDRAPAGAS
jgi:hypothetical protein